MSLNDNSGCFRPIDRRDFEFIGIFIVLVIVCGILSECGDNFNEDMPTTSYNLERME